MLEFIFTIALLLWFYEVGHSFFLWKVWHRFVAYGCNGGMDEEAV